VDSDEEGKGQPADPPTSSAADGRPPARWVRGFSLALTRWLSSSTPQTYPLAPTQLMFKSFATRSMCSVLNLIQTSYMNIYLDLEEDSKIKRSAKILLLEYTRRVLSVYFSPSSKYLCHTDLFLFLEVLSNQKYI
jgi:hypothetical protein